MRRRLLRVLTVYTLVTLVLAAAAFADEKPAKPAIQEEVWAIPVTLPTIAYAAALRAIPNPLVNEAVTVTVLAGITGSASGGMSIALAAMSTEFIAAAKAANIPLEVFHRIAAMASGGMDTLPHNGAVITLLAVTGLTHRQAYKDVFVITLTKTVAVFVAIAFFYLTGLY
jgi:H+/gluconate symporter-like permease